MEVSIARQSPYPVYLNSNFASGSTNTGNGLTFSFSQPITKDPDDLMYVSLTNFLTFNTFANISQYQQNNKFTIMNIMTDNTTGETTQYTKTFVIPDGRYDINQLITFLNTSCNWQEQVNNTAFSTNDSDEAWLYLGLGFDGSNNVLYTTPVLGFTSTNQSSKVEIHPAIDQTANAYLKTYNDGYSIANDPYAYTGVYLIVDDATRGFMEFIGFTDQFIQDPLIAPDIYGYGFIFNPLVTPSAPTTRVYSANIINMAGAALLYMCVDVLQNNSRCNDTQLDQLNIVGAIPISTYYGSIVDYQKSVEEVHLIKELDAVSMVVTFYDQNKKLVHFQGGWWAATLHFTFKSDARKNLIDQQTANTDNRYLPPVDTSYTVANKKQKANDMGGFSVRPNLFL